MEKSHHQSDFQVLGSFFAFSASAKAFHDNMTSLTVIFQSVQLHARFVRSIASTIPNLLLRNSAYFLGPSGIENHNLAHCAISSVEILSFIISQFKSDISHLHVSRIILSAK
jgi:hypothetical protein